MIGKLRGIVTDILGDHILLDVRDVFYIVHCHKKLLMLLQTGQEVVLFTEQITKEFENKLFGFLEWSEKEIFGFLRSVQGVAGKMALTILGTLEQDEIADAIYEGNIAAFQRVPGIGEKLATRLANELKRSREVKNYFTALRTKELMGKVGLADTGARSHPRRDAVAGIEDIVFSALMNLGFAKANIYRVWNDLVQQEDFPSLEAEEVIRRCLVELAKA